MSTTQLVWVWISYRHKALRLTMFLLTKTHTVHFERLTNSCRRRATFSRSCSSCSRSRSCSWRARRASLSLFSRSKSWRSLARRSVDNWNPSVATELVVWSWESVSSSMRRQEKRQGSRSIGGQDWVWNWKGRKQKTCACGVLTEQLRTPWWIWSLSIGRFPLRTRVRPRLFPQVLNTCA